MAKNFLDQSGLAALWNKIQNYYAPTWNTVNFNTLIGPTHNDTDVVLPVTTISTAPGASGVTDHTQALQKTLIWKAATEEYAGVMTAADKTKLNALGSSIEGAISIKNVAIGPTATALTTNNDKEVRFDLQYDAATDTLSLIDLYDTVTPNRVLTSVQILGDALKEALIAGATLTNTNGSTTGTFIKIDFKTTDQDGNETVSSVYANVADLVSTYTAGAGITMTVSNSSLDENPTSLSIALKTPSGITAGGIGGIVPKKYYATGPSAMAPSTHTSRYFSVEADSTGHAFVNVPAGELKLGTTKNASETLNNNETDDTFTAITGIEVQNNQDTGIFTLIPTVKTYTLNKTEDLSVTSNTGSAVGVTANGGTFTAITDITVDDHNISYTKTPFSLSVPNISVGVTSTNANTLIPGSDIGVTAMVGISSNGHQITEILSTLKVQDPASIEISYIESLTYGATATA